jgi:hypothetical protein
MKNIEDESEGCFGMGGASNGGKERFSLSAR